MKRLRNYIGLGATTGSVLVHLGVVFVISVVAAFVFLGPNIAKTLPNLLVGILWSCIIWFTQWIGNGYIIYLLDKKYSWIDEPIKRLLYGFVSLITYSSVAIIAVQLFMETLVLGYRPEDWGLWITHNVRTAVAISLMISIILSAVGFFRNWRKEAKRASGLQSELASFEYALLRNQINPHFLFNSLNVLSELVYEDQATAVKFIRQLSDVYRYVIDSRAKDLVPLTEELEFIRSYIFLLNIRFGDKIRVVLPESTNPKKAVIPMALQILIENAVKHNETSTKNPLNISLSVTDDSLTVSNNLAHKQTPEERSGAGLENISKRYAFFGSKEIVIENSGTHFSVTLPLLEME